MLKKASGIVLASLKASTYGKEYASAFRSLRPRWAAFLTILRGCSFAVRIVMDETSGCAQKGFSTTC